MPSRSRCATRSSTRAACSRDGRATRARLSRTADHGRAGRAPPACAVPPRRAGAVSGRNRADARLRRPRDRGRRTSTLRGACSRRRSSATARRSARCVTSRSTSSPSSCAIRGSRRPCRRSPTRSASAARSRSSWTSRRPRSSTEKVQAALYQIVREALERRRAARAADADQHRDRARRGRAVHRDDRRRRIAGAAARVLRHARRARAHARRPRCPSTRRRERGSSWSCPRRSARE